MTVTLTTTPTYALPGLVQVRVDSTGVAGVNFVEVWCTSAPESSTLGKQLAKDQASRILVADVDNGDTITLKLEEPGTYNFATQESAKGAHASGGGFVGDESGYTTTTVLGTGTATINIGERMLLRVGDQRRGIGDLVVHACGSNIRETTSAIHGEKSPAIISTTSPLALAATADAAVVSAVSGFIGITVAAMTLDIEELWAEMVTDISAHMTRLGGVHFIADSDNALLISELPEDPVSPEGWARAVGIMAKAMRNHFTNSHESVRGTDRWHRPSDYVNLGAILQPASGGDMASVFSALAGIYLAYEAHRTSTVFHDSAGDSANPLGTALPPLLEINRAMISVLNTLEPASAPVQNSATAPMVGLGFRRG